MRFLFAFVLGGVLSLQIPAVADAVSQVAAYALALLPMLQEALAMLPSP